MGFGRLDRRLSGGCHAWIDKSLLLRSAKVFHGTLAPSARTHLRQHAAQVGVRPWQVCQAGTRSSASLAHRSVAAVGQPSRAARPKVSKTKLRETRPSNQHGNLALSGYCPPVEAVLYSLSVNS